MTRYIKITKLESVCILEKKIRLLHNRQNFLKNLFRLRKKVFFKSDNRPLYSLR